MYTFFGGTKDVEIMLPLNYLSDFWRYLRIPLFNCEINPILTWTDKCVLPDYKNAKTLAITNTKIYVPLVTLSTQDNEQLLQQLKSGLEEQLI